MQHENDTPTRYLIPDNFIGEGTVFQGRIKIRNLIEAVILSAVFFFPGLLVIKLSGIQSLQARVSILAALCLPGAGAGIAGFNGDRIFLALKCMAAWVKGRETMLYNPRPVLLRNDPVKAIDSDISTARRLLSGIEQRWKKSMSEKASAELSEGEDFFFAPEEGMEKYVKTNEKSSGFPEEDRQQPYTGGELSDGEAELY